MTDHNNLPTSENKSSICLITNVQDYGLEESTELALDLLIERSERQSLLIAVDELLALIQEQGAVFVDLLQTLSDYADSRIGEVPEESSTWQVVGIFLKNATFKLRTQQRDLPQATMLPKLKYVPEGDPLLRRRLFAIVSQFVKNLLQRGHHFSDIMLALADYADTKVCATEESLPWLRARSFLVDAAIKAETRGRELP